MSYYKDSINERCGSNLCAEVTTYRGHTRVTASRHVKTIGLWSQLVSAARFVMGVGSGVVVKWPHGEVVL